MSISLPHTPYLIASAGSAMCLRDSTDFFFFFTGINLITPAVRFVQTQTTLIHTSEILRTAKRFTYIVFGLNTHVRTCL
jgi:hypothetical protein